MDQVVQFALAMEVELQQSREQEKTGVSMSSAVCSTSLLLKQFLSVLEDAATANAGRDLPREAQGRKRK